ncbi:Endoribonuclease L-PSP/chorismate mutase-like domain-containing protein [Cupriavidus sp. H19C3]
MMTDTPEARLAAAGFHLPAVPTPRGNYAPFCAMPYATPDAIPPADSAASGRASAGSVALANPVRGRAQWISISGQVCRQDGVAMTGQCRTEADLEPARRAAEVSMLNALAALQVACGGDLTRVVQVVRLRGFVRAAPEFSRHPAVLDAASAILRIAFPEQPLPARSALGVSSLPDQAWTEIEVDAIVAAV